MHLLLTLKGIIPKFSWLILEVKRNIYLLHFLQISCTFNVEKAGQTVRSLIDRLNRTLYI